MIIDWNHYLFYSTICILKGVSTQPMVYHSTSCNFTYSRPLVSCKLTIYICPLPILLNPHTSTFRVIRLSEPPVYIRHRPSIHILEVARFLNQKFITVLIYLCSTYSQRLSHFLQSMLEFQNSCHFASIQYFDMGSRNFDHEIQTQYSICEFLR